MKRRFSTLREFMANESSSGIVLAAAALLGMVVANTTLRSTYFETLDKKFVLDVGAFYLSLTTQKFINYLLMTLFFFVVGLEIKNELVSGHLAKFSAAITPFIAALGGMAIPALIYLAISGNEAPAGWAVPVATDIALAVGLVTLMGSRVSLALKSFLLALAVIDDIGAILIIAFIYSTGVIFSWLAAAVIAIATAVLLAKFNVGRGFIYLLVGAVLWYSLYRAGIHPTLAGVIMGLIVPFSLDSKIHTASSFLVVPLFAFANAGVVISHESVQAALNSKVAWGIFFGLFIGKPLGIVFSTLAAARLRVGQMPEGAKIASLTATGSAAGIGFTVAIFLARLAFDDVAMQELAIIAVIAASLASGIVSALLYRTTSRLTN
ncbi:MAG: Na+/H+ antiporter NhaA [Actinobacteria bacterium]|nr:Na+/H+ antiporter NhaA [Actinomycetota bacterium]